LTIEYPYCISRHPYTSHPLASAVLRLIEVARDAMAARHRTEVELDACSIDHDAGAVLHELIRARWSRTVISFCQKLVL
jgi:hypothetical protein